MRVAELGHALRQDGRAAADNNPDEVAIAQRMENNKTRQNI
jgi:hypothetical protein